MCARRPVCPILRATRRPHTQEQQERPGSMVAVSSGLIAAYVGTENQKCDYTARCAPNARNRSHSQEPMRVQSPRQTARTKRRLAIPAPSQPDGYPPTSHVQGRPSSLYHRPRRLGHGVLGLSTPFLRYGSPLNSPSGTARSPPLFSIPSHNDSPDIMYDLHAERSRRPRLTCLRSPNEGISD